MKYEIRLNLNVVISIGEDLNRGSLCSGGLASTARPNCLY